MSASDTLWAMTGLGVVILGGYVAYQATRDRQQPQQQANQSPLVAAGANAAAATQAGATTGYNYTISPSAHSTSPADVVRLAAATQGVISAGLGSVLAPVLAPINAVGGWIGGLI